MSSRAEAIARFLSDPQKRFEIDFYHWSQQDFFSEIDGDYKLLKTVSNSLVTRYLDFAKEISKEDERSLARGLVKKHHPVAAFLLGEGITDQENFLISGLWTGKLEGLLPKVAWAKSELKAALKETVKNAYGEPVASWAHGESEFRTQIKGWTIRTRFDIGGSFAHFSYDHLIQDKQGSDLLVFPTSFLAWLGISAQTYWAANETLDQIVEAFGNVCSHFFAAAHKLLESVE